MKTKSKILLTSMMSIAFASSLIAGSTYALFTSKSEVNIAVTSGKVKVNAAIDETSFQLYSLNEGVQEALEEGTTTFVNGGTVSVNEGTLTLDRMTPGDKVEFDINVKNESNVAVVIRTIIEAEDNELLSGLKFVVDGKSITSDNLSVSSAWKKYGIEETLKPIHVSIELPEEAGNEYQDKAVDLKIAVEALQGNAKFATENEDGTYSDGENTYVKVANDFIEVHETDVNGLYKDDEDNNYVASEDAIQSIVGENGEATSFTMLQDITLSKRIATDGDITINGEGKTLTTTANQAILLWDTTEETTLNLKNINVVGSNNPSNSGIGIYNNKHINVVLDNCSVSTNYYALNVLGDNENIDIVIKNTDLTGYAALNIWSKSNITLENCTLTGLNPWGAGQNNFAVVAFLEDFYSSSAGTTLTCKDCTFVSETSENEEYFFRVDVENVEINIENCSFIYNDEDVTEDLKSNIENNEVSKYVMWYYTTIFNVK